MSSLEFSALSVKSTGANPFILSFSPIQISLRTASARTRPWEVWARSSRLSRQAALAKANKPKGLTGTDRSALLRSADQRRKELSTLQEEISRGGVADQFGNVLNPFTPEQLAAKQAEAAELISDINKYQGMAYPQLANVQTVNP